MLPDARRASAWNRESGLAWDPAAAAGVPSPTTNWWTICAGLQPWRLSALGPEVQLQVVAYRLWES